jgi:hypothetical protein
VGRRCVAYCGTKESCQRSWPVLQRSLDCGDTVSICSPKGILIVQSRVSQLTMMGASVRSRRSGLLYCCNVLHKPIFVVHTAGCRLELRFPALPMRDANYLHILFRRHPMIESSTAITSGRKMGAGDGFILTRLPGWSHCIVRCP